MRERFEADLKAVISLCEEAMDPAMDPFCALGRLARARDRIESAARELYLATDAGRVAVRGS